MIWALVGVLVVGGAAAPVAAQWRPGGLTGPRARATAAHERLEYELSVTPVDHPALSRAQERFTTCGGLLSTASTRKQLLLAEKVAHEGLALLGQD